MTDTATPRTETHTGEALVRIRDLTVRYAPDAPLVLDGVDLDLHRGEMVALLGSSGSGKSTMMKSLTGFAPITSGTVRAGDVDVTRLQRGQLRTLRSQTGQVFQQFNLIGRLSVLTNVLTGSLYGAGPANLLGTFRSADRRRALALLDRVGIAHKAGEEARSLSGGQQQRVAIARALIQEPVVLLADEPVASLDPVSSAGVMDLLREISRDLGLTVICSLHQVELAMEFGDRLTGLQAGRVVLDRAVSRLSRDDVFEVYTAVSSPEVVDADPAQV